MKKAGIFKRIIAGVLCAVTALSLGTIAMTIASAAKVSEVEVSKCGSPFRGMIRLRSRADFYCPK